MRSDSGAGPILGLDHVTLAVAALDAAVATCETLFGTACTRRGTADGLDWACFPLANAALVLLARQGAPGPLASHLAGGPAGAGLGALAFAVADLAGAARLLERRGLPPAGPALPWLGGPAPTRFTQLP